MNELPNKCVDMSIDDFNVSEDCLDALKRSGVWNVNELVRFFERTWGGRGTPGHLSSKFLKHVPEMVNQLKAIGCWPDDLEDIDLDEGS